LFEDKTLVYFLIVHNRFSRCLPTCYV